MFIYNTPVNPQGYYNQNQIGWNNTPWNAAYGYNNTPWNAAFNTQAPVAWNGWNATPWNQGQNWIAPIAYAPQPIQNVPIHGQNWTGIPQGQVATYAPIQQGQNIPQGQVATYVPIQQGQNIPQGWVQTQQPVQPTNWNGNTPHTVGGIYTANQQNGPATVNAA